MSSRGTAFYLCALITGMGVVATGQDFGWWGDKPVTCQAPGAQTTATDTQVHTVATIAQRAGDNLAKLNGPPPSTSDMYATADEWAQGAVAGVLALRDAARKQKQSEYVEKYNRRKYESKVKRLAQVTAACSPCPGATPDGQPLTVAHKTSGEALARSAAQAAGFRGAHLEEAVAVARAESTFNPTGANPTSTARGMWQIMLSAHQDDPDIRNWRDPYASARMAYRISDGGTDWSPWSVWPAVKRELGTQPVSAAQPVDSYTCAVAPKAGAVDNVAWKRDHQNGRIPASALCAPKTAPTARFRCDAAAAFDQLSTAYKARFGTYLPVTDSYRDYAGQVSCRARKGSMCADPGTSNHGWGLAADLGGGVQRFGTPQKQWMDANAPKYGWVNPSWARPGGNGPLEAWHHEYVGAGTTA